MTNFKQLASYLENQSFYIDYIFFSTPPPPPPPNPPLCHLGQNKFSLVRIIKNALAMALVYHKSLYRKYTTTSWSQWTKLEYYSEREIAKWATKYHNNFFFATFLSNAFNLWAIYQYSHSNIIFLPFFS